MLTALVKDFLLTTFVCINEWLALHVLVNLRAIPIWKGFRKIRPKGIPIRKRLLLQGKGVKPYHYKNRAPSRRKVRMILPSLALQSSENSSDLIFGGYLAGTTPVHSARILSSRCAGVIRRAQGPCDLLVIFSASSVTTVQVSSNQRISHNKNFTLNTLLH